MSTGLLKKLRLDMMDELQAINDYQEHIDSTNNQEAKEVLEHIRDDEKEHVAMLTKLIATLDSGQKDELKEQSVKVSGEYINTLGNELFKTSANVNPAIFADDVIDLYYQIKMIQEQKKKAGNATDTSSTKKKA